jgi:hypothetical protein
MGVIEQVATLRSFGVTGDDRAIQALLSKHGYSIERAASAFFEEGPVEPSASIDVAECDGGSGPATAAPSNPSPPARCAHGNGPECSECQKAMSLARGLKRPKTAAAPTTRPAAAAGSARAACRRAVVDRTAAVRQGVLTEWCVVGERFVVAHSTSRSGALRSGEAVEIRLEQPQPQQQAPPPSQRGGAAAGRAKALAPPKPPPRAQHGSAAAFGNGKKAAAASACAVRFWSRGGVEVKSIACARGTVRLLAPARRGGTGRRSAGRRDVVRARRLRVRASLAMPTRRGGTGRSE